MEPEERLRVVQQRLVSMKCIYHSGYHVVLPEGHPFPISKYSLLKDLLLREGIVTVADVLPPDPIEIETLALVHTPEYLRKLMASDLTTAEQRRLGMPWSDALWLRSRLASGGTLLAARTALLEGLSANLAGGTHHAFADHGEGFCVVNDVAVAVAQLRLERAIRRAVVIDLDVHQGNGTAAIFETTPEVFTFSMHGARNYPSDKMRSDLDVELPDGTADAVYLERLARHLPAVLDACADIVFYLAGVDVAAGDRYGRLALTDEGIRLRERAVIDAVRSRNIPLVILLAGGYARTRMRTAELHAHVMREAVDYEGRGARTPQ